MLCPAPVSMMMLSSGDWCWMSISGSRWVGRSGANGNTPIVLRIDKSLWSLMMTHSQFVSLNRTQHCCGCLQSGVHKLFCCFVSESLTSWIISSILTKLVWTGDPSCVTLVTGRDDVVRRKSKVRGGQGVISSYSVCERMLFVKTRLSFELLVY